MLGEVLSVVETSLVDDVDEKRLFTLLSSSTKHFPTFESILLVQASWTELSCAD